MCEYRKVETIFQRRSKTSSHGSQRTCLNDSSSLFISVADPEHKSILIPQINVTTFQAARVTTQFNYALLVRHHIYYKYKWHSWFIREPSCYVTLLRHTGQCVLWVQKLIDIRTHGSFANQIVDCITLSKTIERTKRTVRYCFTICRDCNRIKDKRRSETIKRTFRTKT